MYRCRRCGESAPVTTAPPLAHGWTPYGDGWLCVWCAMSDPAPDAHGEATEREPNARFSRKNPDSVT